MNSGAAQPCLPLGSRGVHQPEEVTEGLGKGSPQAAPRTHTEEEGGKSGGTHAAFISEKKATR